MFVRRFALAVALVVAACTQPPSSGTGPGPAAMAVPASLNEAPRERLGPKPEEAPSLLGLASRDVETLFGRPRFVRKDGEVIWISVLSSSVRDRDGNFQYCLRVIQDITERKTADPDAAKT